MNKPIRSILWLLAGVAISCTQPTGSGQRADSTGLSESRPDYAGTYTGVLPCADCPGIKTEITLRDDRSFTKRMTYLAKEEPAVLEEEGKYTRDASGDTITLEGLRAPNRYLVGEHTLTQLDLAGRKIEGELAELYVLTK